MAVQVPEVVPAPVLEAALALVQDQVVARVRLAITLIAVGKPVMTQPVKIPEASTEYALNVTRKKHLPYLRWVTMSIIGQLQKKRLAGKMDRNMVRAADVIELSINPLINCRIHPMESGL